MPARPVVVKDAVDPGDEFETVDIDIKGKTFKIRELSSKEYDRCVELATEDGETDTIKLLRWMVIKSVVEPEGFSAEKLGNLSFTTVRKLSAAVNDIHFPKSEDSPES